MERPIPDRHRRTWTQKEDEYLQWNWSEKTIEVMATDLARTQWAVAVRAVHLRLGPYARGTMSLREVERFSGFSVTKIKQAVKKLRLRVPRALTSEPGQKRTAEFAFTEDMLETVTAFMLENPLIYSDKKGAQRSTRGAWGVGKKPPACLRCGKDEKPHYAKGHCRYCYFVVSGLRKPYERTGNRAGEKYWEKPVLSVERVEEMRNKRRSGISYGALAREYGVSRTSVSRICRGKDWIRAGGPVEPYTHNNVTRAPGDPIR